MLAVDVTHAKSVLPGGLRCGSLGRARRKTTTATVTSVSWSGSWSKSQPRSGPKRSQRLDRTGQPPTQTRGEPEVGVLDHGQERVDPAGEHVEHRRPGTLGEPFTQPLGDVEIVDAQQSVVVAQIADTGGIELAGEPLAAIHVDLDLERQPGLHPDMKPSSGSM